MTAPRSSFLEGHRRKFLVVIDDTPECDRALIYAAKRAERTAGGVVLLNIIVPETDAPQWLGVEEVMRAEALGEAETLMARAAERARSIAHVEPEIVIREGGRAEEIMKLIGEDTDIAILVLAAGSDTEGPGPLVTAIAGRAAGTFPIPITIVPGTLSDAELAAGA